MKNAASLPHQPEEAFPLISKQEKRARLRLLRSENVGIITFFDLIKRHGTAEEALHHLNVYAQQGGKKKPLVLATEKQVDSEIKETTRAGAHFLLHGDHCYPKSLMHIYDPPPILIYKGRKTLFQREIIGIVGARNASLNGKKIAKSFSNTLGEMGWGIASGLARGIDRAAHEGALQSGTIACVAGGIDDIYPKENADLFEDISEKGLLVTESPIGTKPHASLFPRRNRLVSGLSRGVIVIEAALKSGSLITARLALEQGREVFAVPGSPLDPRSHGTNALIQQGAKLVQKAEDVLDTFQESNSYFTQDTSESYESCLREDLPVHERKILQEQILVSLSYEPVSVDEVFRDFEYSYSSLSHVLIELELAGRLIRHPGNQISKVLEPEE